MSNLSAFMRANVQQVENHKYAASPRIKGEDGKPMEWEICCISADEYAHIRSACIRQVPVPGKKGQYTQQLDTYTFQAKVAARCTVFPDLNNAALQNDWGVAKPEELIGKLFDGSPDKLFAALLDNQKLSREQIENLRRMVAELE